MHIMSRKGEYQSRATPAHASPRTKQEAGGIEGHTHSSTRRTADHTAVSKTRTIGTTRSILWGKRLRGLTSDKKAFWKTMPRNGESRDAVNILTVSNRVPEMNSGF